MARRTLSRGSEVLLAAAVLAAAVSGRGSPAAAATAWRHLAQGTAVDPVAAPVALVGLAAWLLACWLSALLVLAGVLRVTRQPHPAAHLLLRLAPRPFRGPVRTVLGLAVATSVLTASPALAAPADPTGGRVPAVTLEWPATDLARPAAAVTRPAEAPAAPRTVLVQPGDCLWSLVAASLGPGATDRRVAALWPRWWSANRTVIGDDPDLLRPGTHLTVPAPHPTEEPS